MAVTAWLIDKSALVRLGTSRVADEWANHIQRGLIHITTLTRLEVGFSAKRSSELRTAARRPPMSLMPVEYLTPAIEERAVEVQMILADRGHHRGPSIPDLLIAATAELADLTILHLDKDFETIAAVTGQSAQRLN